MGRVVTKSIGATPEIVERRGYDDVGRLTTVWDGAGVAANYYYDNTDRITQDVVAGKSTRYYYDGAGRLTKKGASDGTIDVREFFYSATTGLMTRVSLTNGANTDSVDYYYDGAGRVIIGDSNPF